MEDLWSYVLDDEDPAEQPACPESDGVFASRPWVRRYAVLPSRARPRWLIPIVSPKITAATLATHRPFRRRSRLAVSLARASARVGLLPRLRHTVVVARARPPWVERAVSEIVGATCVVALAAGGSPKRQKIVAVAVDGTGSLRAFAKLARSDSRRVAILREREALRYVVGRDVAPAFLGEAANDGTCMVVQAPLAGSPGGAGGSDAECALLARLRHTAPAPLAATSWMRELTAAVADARTCESTAFSPLSAAVSATSLRPVVVHGDFAPWNLRVHGAAARAIDWECWNVSGPPVVDSAHHLLQSTFLLDHADDAVAFSRVATLARSYESEIGAHDALALCGLGIVEYLLRRRDEGYPDDDLLARRYRGTLARIVHAAGASS